jgi:hypothetical protein
VHAGVVAPRAGNPDTWAENDGRSPTIALAEPISELMSGTNTVTIYLLLQLHSSHGNADIG